MTALQCEICGGKLMAKSGGLFECEYCGMQYDKIRVREMIQEIKGTVKVEGTVEVTGTVKLDGPVEVKGGATLDSFLKRGFFALEDRNWDEARVHFNEALNMNAECAEAYLGLTLASFELTDKEGLASAELNYEKDSNFIKAMRFASPELKAELTEKTERFRPLYTARLESLAALRQRAQKCEKLFAAGGFDEDSFFARPDGTVHMDRIVHYDKYYMEKHNAFCDELKKAEDIVAVCGGDTKLGLRSDGRVCSFGSGGGFRLSDKVNGWTDIVQLGTFATGMVPGAVGLRSDGTVVSTGRYDFSDWSDIVYIACSDGNVVGVKADGTAVTTADMDISGWTDIVAADIIYCLAVGLRSGGTVVYAGKTTVKNDWGKEYDLSEIGNWKDIVSIHAANRAVVGLRADGTMVGAGIFDSSRFSKNVIAFDIEGINNGVSVYCLLADGSMERNGNVKKGWKFFDNIDNMEQERLAARQKREEERRKAEEARRRREEAKRLAEERKREEERLAEEKRREEERIAREKKEAEEKLRAQRREAGKCQYCGGELKGFFSKKCTSCGKPKDY